jgi:hypothetical protein
MRRHPAIRQPSVIAWATAVLGMVVAFPDPSAA